MPDASGTHTDGGLIFGSQLVAMPFAATPPAATLFVAKNIKFNRPTKLLESPDELGRPGKEALINQNLTGTMTLQIVSDASVCPPNFTIFKLQPRGGGALIWCKVTDNGEDSDQNAEGTFAITFRGLLHPPTG